MISQTFTSASGLCYRLTTSEPSLQQDQVTLTLHVTNPTPAPIACTGITLAFPVTTSARANALTTHPETITATASPGWSITPTKPGTYRATPTGSTVPAGARVTFTLAGIRRAADGASSLKITVKPDAIGGPSVLIPVRFWPDGDDGTFTGFYADTTAVERGGKATLHWVAAKNDLIQYSLTYNTGGVDAQDVHLNNDDLKQYAVTDTSDSKLNDYTYTTQALDGLVVGYQLGAVYKSSVDEAKKVLTTASFIQRGDLEAGSINSVAGPAQILTPGQQGFSNNTQYVAPTDGILYGSIVSASTDQLWATINPPSSGQGGHPSMPSMFHLVLPETSPDKREGTFNRNFTIPVGKDSTLQFGFPSQDCTLTWQPLGSQPNGTGNLTEDLVSYLHAAPQFGTQKSVVGWPSDQIVEDFYPDALTVPAGHTTNLRWHGPKNDSGTPFSYTLTYSLYSGAQTQPVTLNNDDLQKCQTPDPNNNKLAYYVVPTQPLNGVGIGFHLAATYQPDQGGPLYSDFTTAAVVTGGDIEVGHISVSGSTKMLLTNQTPLKPNTSYTAPTDGFLFGSVQNGALLAHITPSGEPDIKVAISSNSFDYTSADNKNFTVPVRKSSKITFSLPGVQPTGYKLTWHSLGTGNLA